MAKPIYVSAFEVVATISGEIAQFDFAAPDIFDPRHPLNTTPGLGLPIRAVELLRRIKASGVEFTLFSDFWEYGDIEAKIEQSSGLLAVVDQYYMSSTGRMNDISSAGGLPRMSHSTPGKGIPVFVYPIEKNAVIQFCRVFRSVDVTILPEDADAAHDVLVNFFLGR